MDSLTTNGVPKASTPAEQPGPSWPSAGEKPPATTITAEPDQTSIKKQVRIWVAQRMRASYPSLLAATDDEPDGKEEEQPQPRRTQITSGKLRTMDTTAVKHVLWPHELVFTPDGQPAVYDSISCMAFVNGICEWVSLNHGSPNRYTQE